MACNNSSYLNWEEDEYFNPIGWAEWVLNQFKGEFAVFNPSGIPVEEDAPCNNLQDKIEFTVLLKCVTSIFNHTFHGCCHLNSI